MPPITLDPAQAIVKESLDGLSARLIAYEAATRQKLVKLGLKKIMPPSGLYIYGDVGRGKSMLMDGFFEEVTITHKRRVHFHEFMLEIHARIHQWRQAHKNQSGSHDPIPPLADHIAKDCLLLCFDELQVTDITDAMLLGRLFAALFERGVVMVSTSNRPPDDLYKDGLQRESFLPCIELLKEKLEVIRIGGEHDYRLDGIKALASTYFSPLGPKADDFAMRSFESLAGGHPICHQELTTQGRTVDIPRSAGSCCLFTFHELCENPLGAADYSVICADYKVIIVTGIPQLSPMRRNEAKRLVILIDTVYEHHRLLICTAAIEPTELYTQGEEAFEFQRSVSRLIEMQSQEYRDRVLTTE